MAITRSQGKLNEKQVYNNDTKSGMTTRNMVRKLEPQNKLPVYVLRNRTVY